MLRCASNWNGRRFGHFCCLSRTRDFSDKFGHSNCIILREFAIRRFAANAVNALIPAVLRRNRALSLATSQATALSSSTAMCVMHEAGFGTRKSVLKNVHAIAMSYSRAARRDALPLQLRDASRAYDDRARRGHDEPPSHRQRFRAATRVDSKSARFYGHH